MPPRRRTSAAQPLSTQTDVAPRRTARGKSGTSGNPPTEELLSLPNTQPPALGLPLPNKSPVVLPRQLPWSILATYRRCWKRGQPSTPARQAMNRLVTQMSAQAAMASPGPRLHAPGAGSDGESEPGSNAETSDSETGPLPYSLYFTNSPILTSVSAWDHSDFLPQLPGSVPPEARLLI
ncbi:hypothetical protein B0H14DRAFT_2567854 [Mycena olivaceomarginata]|nr:hypothetical protein B0H14DRAFT_2567854 [Mycena olivaceomarginata]